MDTSLSQDDCILSIRTLVDEVDVNSGMPFLEKILQVNDGLLDRSILPCDYVHRMRKALKQTEAATPDVDATRLLELFEMTIRPISKPEEQAKDNKVHLGVHDPYYEKSCDNSAKKISEGTSTLEEECEQLWKRFTAAGTVHSASGHQQLEKGRVKNYIRDRITTKLKKLKESQIGESLEQP